MRHMILTLAAAVTLSGCAASPATSPVAPTAAAPVAAALVAGQQVTVDPNEFSLCPPSSGTVTAITNFDGPITAIADNNCSVSPASQNAVVVPGSGGTKRATFTITLFNYNGCHVTVTDRKGNTATIVVTPDTSISCLL